MSKPTNDENENLYSDTLAITINEPENCEALELFIGSMIVLEREMSIYDAASSPKPVEHASSQDHT